MYRWIPVVRAPGQRRRLVSALMQDKGETPEQASALFTVLTGRPASEALCFLTASGGGRLFKIPNTLDVGISSARRRRHPLPCRTRSTALSRIGNDGRSGEFDEPDI